MRDAPPVKKTMERKRASPQNRNDMEADDGEARGKVGSNDSVCLTVQTSTIRTREKQGRSRHARKRRNQLPILVNWDGART